MKQGWWLTLLILLAGFSHITHAAEAPGALTILVTDQITDRPLSSAQIVITKRENNTTQSVETDAQGRIVLEQLAPGLYSVNVARNGFAASFEPSVRVITRKNVQIEFALREQVVQEVVVQGRQADRLASASSSYLNREALRSAVGGGADPLLSLDGLPGLASTGEFANFRVRGRGPRDNLLLVDDFPFDKVGSCRGDALMLYPAMNHCQVHWPIP